MRSRYFKHRNPLGPFLFKFHRNSSCVERCNRWTIQDITDIIELYFCAESDELGQMKVGGRLILKEIFFCLDTHKTHTCTKTAFRDFQKNTSWPRYLLGFGIWITWICFCWRCFYFGKYEIGTFFQPFACGISQSLMIDWRDWSVGGEAYSRKLYQLVPKCLDLFVKMWFQAKQLVIL